MKNCPLECENKIKDFFLHFYKCANRVKLIKLNKIRIYIKLYILVVNITLHILYIRMIIIFILKHVQIKRAMIRKHMTKKIIKL